MTTTGNTARQAKRQKTDDDSSTAAADDRNNVSLPTEEDISSALCKIGDTEKYTTDEVKKALTNLYTWRITSDNNQDECVRISKEFMDLGGIPRILNFLKRNKDNIVFMLRASEVIRVFLHPGPNDEHLEIAFTMAQKFVEREGVEMILSIIEEQYTGELEMEQLNTLDNIFGVFFSAMCNMNAKNMVDIDKFSPIIHSGISTLAILSNIRIHDVAVALVKENIFMFFRTFVYYNAEMIDAVEFHEKNIFSECVRALKNPVNNTWKYDKQAWEQATIFFYQCCYMNRKILSQEDDFEVIVPFLIQFMKEDPNHAITTSCIFHLLRKASNTIGKKKMITSNKVLLEVLGTVAACGNDNANGVNEEAIILMKYLIEEY